MICKDLNELLPGTQVKVRAWLQECETIVPQKILITCTYRPQIHQDAEWARGRESLEKVNELRKAAGLPPITEKQNRIVTWTRRSKHTERRAVDFALKMIDPYDTKADIDNDEIPDYREVGECAVRHGLQWGIILKSGAHADLCHVQDNTEYAKETKA